MQKEQIEARAPRKGMPSPKLGEAEFKKRYRDQFFDPAFRPYDAAIEGLADVAWQAYCDSRKSPITRKAGPEFADPDYNLSVECSPRETRLERPREDLRMRYSRLASSSSMAHRAASTPVRANCPKATDWPRSHGRSSKTKLVLARSC